MNVKEIISNTTISKLLIPITAILLLVLTIRKRATIFLWFRKALSIINSTILFIATHIKILQKILVHGFNNNLIKFDYYTQE